VRIFWTSTTLDLLPPIFFSLSIRNETAVGFGEVAAISDPFGSRLEIVLAETEVKGCRVRSLR
jgi:hypothetical protein